MPSRMISADLSFFEESALEVDGGKASSDDGSEEKSSPDLPVDLSLQLRQRGSRSSMPFPSFDKPEVAETPSSAPSTDGIRLASHAKNESGDEVEEVDYLSRFNKRINKVI